MYWQVSTTLLNYLLFFFGIILNLNLDVTANLTT